ncbi:S41 family peptidase [Enterococcus faecalis]|uniref:S41 family peptidase n=1 Tax=Enterococcus faecalis TaxID=1351 RepID=UPI002FBF0C6D
MVNKFLKSKINLLISSILVLFVFIFGLLFLLPKQLKIETRGYEVIQFMGKYGVIENNALWEKNMRNTETGRKIETIDQLNDVVHQANGHSSAFEYVGSSDQRIAEFMPSSSTVDEFTIITMPSIYTDNDEFLEGYVNELLRLIQDSSGDLVIDLTNNTGGSREPMIVGVSSLIPDGELFKEIDNKQNSYPLFLKDKKLIGGIPGSLWEGINGFDFLNMPKKLNQKIAVLINHKTASAAENVLVALKNNENVKIFGESSAGLTTLNTVIALPHAASDSLWIVNCTIGFIEMDGEINDAAYSDNRKIDPDFETNFSFMTKSNQELLNELRLWFSR